MVPPKAERMVLRLACIDNVNIRLGKQEVFLEREFFFPKKTPPGLRTAFFVELMAGYLPFLAGALPVGTVAIV